MSDANDVEPAAGRVDRLLHSMRSFPIRGRPWRQVAIAAALVAGVLALLLRPVLEHAARSRIEAAAARRGMEARIGALHVGLWPLVRIEGFDLELGHGARLHADRVAATWPGRLRLSVRSAVLSGPARLEVSAPASTWNVSGLLFGGELRLSLVQPQSGLSIRRRADPAGSAWNLDARELDIGRLFQLSRDGRPLLDGGVADGSVSARDSSNGLRFGVDVGVRGARLGGLAESADDEPGQGTPTDVSLRFEGDWQRRRGTLDIPGIRSTVAGADLSGSLALRDLDTDPAIDLALGVQRLDFAKLLAASGLPAPEALGLVPGQPQDLGSATIELKVRGRLAEPALLSVSQKIDFTPPRVMPSAITRLRRDFVFDAAVGRGRHRPIDVSPTSTDFIAMHDVPPLFVRALLLAEDSDFLGHRGIDLRELPGALITNWSRGTAARGASTITQQLAKNLFLSRDKQLGRKLQELSIAFLLESALGKERILEIYVNVIEWGPGLRGLRPAARAYFGREPRALTPAQMAFLVSIIPGPIKYQSSFADGSPGPGLRALIDGLLAKLRSVDAIGEDEYRQALQDPINVAAPH